MRVTLLRPEDQNMFGLFKTKPKTVEDFRVDVRDILSSTGSFLEN